MKKLDLTSISKQYIINNFINQIIILFTILIVYFFLREIVENHNITWHENMISYIPKRTIIYVPEMSINDPKKDIIHVPNIPMLVSIIQISNL